MPLPNHRISRPTFGAVALAVTLAALAALLVMLGQAAPPAGATHSCSGVQIHPGDDLDAIVNRDPADRATTFCVHAPSAGATYWINNTVLLRAGDKLLGQPGQVVTRGPASYGVPPVKVRTAASLKVLLRPHGPNVQVRWLDIAGGVLKFRSNGTPTADSGHGIDAGRGTATTRLEYLAIHDNQAAGINSMNGKVLHSNFYNNGTNPKAQGFQATGIKGVDEFEAAYNYVHDNAGNGIWCDSGCDNVAGMANGFWAHHNLVVNNRRFGIRYENSPQFTDGGGQDDRLYPAVTALVEHNAVHGNGSLDRRHGISMHDAQNGTFRNNRFGAATIAGVSYQRNHGAAIGFTWESGRADRTDLWNGKAYANALNGEYIKGCGMRDNDSQPGGVLVSCSNN
jgi:hypothetical protein